jgi:hypothetical protein
MPLKISRSPFLVCARFSLIRFHSIISSSLLKAVSVSLNHHLSFLTALNWFVTLTLPRILVFALDGVVADSFSFPDVFPGSALHGEGDYVLSCVIAHRDNRHKACVLAGPDRKWWEFEDAVVSPQDAMMSFSPSLLIYVLPDVLDLQVDDADIPETIREQLGILVPDEVEVPLPGAEIPLPEIVAEELLETRFFAKVREWSAALASGRAAYKFGDENVDVRLLLNDTDPEIVLGTYASFFRKLFQFVGNQRDNLDISLEFPFPKVLAALIGFFYVMTNPEFDLDEFLLIAILPCLHEKNLLPRVRALLSGDSVDLPASSSFISQVKPFFTSAAEYRPYVNLAVRRMQCTVGDLLPHWNRCPAVPDFVNPRPSGPSPLSSFMALSVTWKTYLANATGLNGCFPPAGFTDARFGSEGISQFVIEGWYLDFYDWALALDDRRQYIVMGTSGIGKSIFCLYFMSRLIASNLTQFHGHDYFDVSWKEDRIHYPQITLKGKVRPISVFEFERDGDKKVFRLLDGWSYSSSQNAFPTLAILSPGQAIEWKDAPFLRHAPTRRHNDFLEHVSTRHGFDDRDRENPDYPAAVYGTITSRMKIVGGNLRLLFGPDTLEGLKKFLLEGWSRLG